MAQIWDVHGRRGGARKIGNHGAVGIPAARYKSGAHACMKAPGCSGWATSSAWLAVGRPALQLTEGRLLARPCMMQICSRALLFACNALTRLEGGAWCAAAEFAHPLSMACETGAALPWCQLLAPQKLQLLTEDRLRCFQAVGRTR